MASKTRVRILFILFVSALYLSVGLMAFFVYRSMKQYFLSSSTAHSTQISRPDPVPLHLLVDLPYLFAQNPEHPEINAQGLRDDEVAIPKPAGTLRILILGDSVTFGYGVPAKKTFPNQLEELLTREFEQVDVINAGVSGYTAYNELQYYLTKGREFKPDIVIMAFCLNDVANPRLHWNYTKEKIQNIPESAIPNFDYDANHARPIMKEGKKRPLPNLTEKIPTYITGEDTISIHVLLDESSPEWQWLASIYDQLRHAVKKDGAKLIVLMIPLAYQMNDDYPFFPQKLLASYCEGNAIPCIDLLPSFLPYPKDRIFFLANSPAGHYDVWHLTRFGHKLTATVINRFLQANSGLFFGGHDYKK